MKERTCSLKTSIKLISLWYDWKSQKKREQHQEGSSDAAGPAWEGPRGSAAHKPADERGSVGEVGPFLPPQMATVTQNEVGSSNSLTVIEETDFVIKKLPKVKSPGADSFTGDINEEVTSVLPNVSPLIGTMPVRLASHPHPP